MRRTHAHSEEAAKAPLRVFRHAEQSRGNEANASRVCFKSLRPLIDNRARLLIIK